MPWTTSYGKTYMKQKDTHSCAIACCATVVGWFSNTQPTEEAIRQISKQHTGSYVPSSANRTGATPTPFLNYKPGQAILQNLQPPSAGTDTDNVIAILRSYGHTVNHVLHPTPQDIAVAGPNTAVILKIKWGSGGYHMAVVGHCDTQAPMGRVVCDPGYHTVIMQDPNTMQYHVPGISTGDIVEILQIYK